METTIKKETIEELKIQWKKLWYERIDDKVRAEGIANSDYPVLFVEKGTVIFATRNFKPLNFREILELHEIVDIDKITAPNPYVGGWRKFMRTVIASQRGSKRAKQAREHLNNKKQKQQLKKGGRGWLHY